MAEDSSALEGVTLTRTRSTLTLKIDVRKFARANIDLFLAALKRSGGAKKTKKEKIPSDHPRQTRMFGDQ